MPDRALTKVGGISGITLGVVQLAGIVMHGSIPADPTQGLTFVYEHPVWKLTHILLIVSYLFVVGFYIGLNASFRKSPPLVQVGGNLILVGAFLGALHFTIHLSFYYYAANEYHSAAAPLGNKILLLYHSLHHYAHLLNRCSLIIMMFVALIFSFSILRDGNYKKWLGKLGIVAALLTLVTIVVIELFLPRKTGDLIFAATLLPTIVWLVAMGIAMLRFRFVSPELQPGV